MGEAESRSFRPTWYSTARSKDTRGTNESSSQDSAGNLVDSQRVEGGLKDMG